MYRIAHYFEETAPLNQKIKDRNWPRKRDVNFDPKILNPSHKSVDFSVRRIWISEKWNQIIIITYHLQKKTLLWNYHELSSKTFYMQINTSSPSVLRYNMVYLYMVSLFCWYTSKQSQFSHVSWMTCSLCKTVFIINIFFTPRSVKTLFFYVTGIACCTIFFHFFP